MPRLVTNKGSLIIYNDDKVVRTIPHGGHMSYPSDNGRLTIALTAAPWIFWDFDPEITLDGVELPSLDALIVKLSSFKRGGDTGEGVVSGIQSISPGDNVTITGDEANPVINAKGGTSVWTGTKAEHDAIGNKDPETIYILTT